MLKSTAEQNIQTKENDSRLIISSFLFKQENEQDTTTIYPPSSDTAVPPPYPLYDSGGAVAIPFVWESKPGTPKHPSSLNHQSSNRGGMMMIPPLTPPPSYYTYPHTKKPVKLRRRLKLEFWKAIPKIVVCFRGMSRKVISGCSSTVAAGRKDRSSSPGGRIERRKSKSPLSPVSIRRFREGNSRSTSINRSTRKTKPLSGYLASKEDDDEEEDDEVEVKSRRRRSPNSPLCFSLW